MRVIDVTIEGTKPLLQHNPLGMQGKPAAGKKSIPTPVEEADAGRYLMPDGSSLMEPAEHIHSAMIAASGSYKIKRQSLSAFVAGSVEVAPEHIPHGTLEFTIDTRRAVIQRNGVLRSRPKLWPWKLSFQLLVDQDFPVSDLGVLRQILEEAGRRLGIGDFRPQKKGKFGKFVVTLFEERAA